MLVCLEIQDIYATGSCFNQLKIIILALTFVNYHVYEFIRLTQAQLQAIEREIVLLLDEDFSLV